MLYSASSIKFFYIFQVFFDYSNRMELLKVKFRKQNYKSKNAIKLMLINSIYDIICVLFLYLIHKL